MERGAAGRIGLLLIGVVALVLIPVPIASAGELFFTDIFNPNFSDGWIRRVESDGTGMQALVTTGGGLRGITIDRSEGKMYWTDVDNDVIRRANLDGSGQEDIVTSGLSFPMAIDVDPYGNRIYWGDTVLGVIQRAGLDGSNPTTVLSTPFGASIQLDIEHGKMYWTTSLSSTSGEILRANIDGGMVETLVTGVDKPARIAVDVHGGKIYWTDFVVDVVRRSDLDGTNVEDLFVVGANLNPDGIALDLLEGKVYWGQSTTTNREKIMRMNLDGSDPEEVIGGFGIVSDIFIIPKHPCAYGGVNAGCAWTHPVLLMNGMTGGDGCTLQVSPGYPVTFLLFEPVSRRDDGQTSRACVYAWIGEPTGSDIVTVPKGLGPMCFGPLILATKNPKKIWNALGHSGKLGEDNAPGPPPEVPDNGYFQLLSLPAGVLPPITVTFQGLIEDDCSKGTVPLSVTNGIILKVF